MEEGVDLEDGLVARPARFFLLANPMSFAECLREPRILLRE